MAYTFDGANSEIVLSSGTTSLDVKDMYSRWKDWVRDSGGSKFLEAFRTAGGDPTTGTNFVASYFFLTNGWRVRPQEASHQLTVSGSLVVDGGGNPYQTTVGSYNVQVVSEVPVKAEGIATSGSSPSDIADALLDDELVESGLTVRGALRIALAALAGKVSGADGSTVTIRDVNDTTDRIVATVDADGNRTAVTVDPD